MTPSTANSTILQLRLWGAVSKFANHNSVYLLVRTRRCWRLACKHLHPFTMSHSSQHSSSPPLLSFTASLRNLWTHVHSRRGSEIHRETVNANFHGRPQAHSAASLPLVLDYGMSNATQPPSITSRSSQSFEIHAEPVFRPCSPDAITSAPHSEPARSRSSPLNETGRRDYQQIHTSIVHCNNGTFRSAKSLYSSTEPEQEPLREKDPATSPGIGTFQQKIARPSIFQRLWLRWFTAYRVLIFLAFVINLAMFVLWIKSNKQIDMRLPGSLTATATNIFVAVLVRQEDLINMSFRLLARTPSSLPIGIRKYIADFHHYGGLHIGCAIAALLWYCLFVAANTITTIDHLNRGIMNGWIWADITTCYVFLLFLALICVTAHPRLRARFHNTFEHTHRFAGWAALIVLWINSGISSMAHSTSQSLAENPALWLLAATSFLIILPWLRMCSVPIQASAVSSREVKLTFPYANMPYTSTTRFSLSPLLEWHAFATIPSRDGFTSSIIISQAGDWTKAIIQDPPNKIWIRNPPASNFLALTPIFNSVLLVATGAGIGPMLSLLSSPAVSKMRHDGKSVKVMWCVYDPEAPHWRFVQETIRRVDPFPKIFDSRQGRPDMAFEARYMAHTHNIEAVMIVSNKKVTDEVVDEVKAHGGAAYGAVFDS